MKPYFIVGEASGDLHASNLAKQLKVLDPNFEARGWGGDLMTEAGVDIVKHYRDLAFMGFAEVLMNIRTIKKNFKLVKEDILAYQPDVLILVDYPGFNLRIAEWAHEHKIPVFYYISPQVWAWKKGRVHKIKRFVDQMYVILPFEAEFYSKYDYAVHYVGHPLLDVISEEKHDENARRSAKQAFIETHELDERPIVALLPGSRKQEIKSMLATMLEVAKDFPSYQFVIAGAPAQEPSFYESLIPQDAKHIKLVFGATYDLFRNAEAGLVTSGTATLEAGLFQLPQAVCYKGSAISYHIAKRIVNIKYISLVNLILDKEAVKELIQSDFNKENVAQELKALLNDAARKDKMNADYKALHKVLGGSGASQRTASLMLETWNSMNRK